MSTFGTSLLRSQKRDAASRRKKYVSALETRNQAAAESTFQRAHNATSSALRNEQGRSALTSVWDTTDIESFLQVADSRQAGYTAERSVKVVLSGSAHVLLGDKVAPLSDNQHDWLALSSKLPIPKRPAWKFEMSPQQIDIQELASFANWREALNEIEESDKVMLSPFEKNLEVWRQLWRVVERSDVVVNVVDARNPLAFRCKDFEKYAAQHAGSTGRPKPVVLLLNKADLLSERQREAWAEYLNENNICFYFFSAKPLEDPKAEKLRQEQDDLAREIEEALQLKKLQDQDEKERMMISLSKKNAAGGGNKNTFSVLDEENNNDNDDDNDNKNDNKKNNNKKNNNKRKPTASEDEDDEGEESFEDIDSDEEEKEKRQQQLEKLRLLRDQKQLSQNQQNQQQQNQPGQQPFATAANEYSTNKKSSRRAAKHRSLRGVPVSVQNENFVSNNNSSSTTTTTTKQLTEEEQVIETAQQQKEQQQALNNKKNKKKNNKGGGFQVETGSPISAPTLPSLKDVPKGSNKIYSASELVDEFATYWRQRVVLTSTSSPTTTATPPPVMIGFVGYPNVGKSSTINALIGSKKVVVSATPGKTKHFQTLPIPQEDRVMLCDCPGLVFPSCAATKETMVCDGVLPIDNCRDFVAPISVVCRRVPRFVLEQHYHVTIDPEQDVDHSNSSAEVVLAVIARRRGYMTDHERPNRSRAARDVLKDFVDGKVVFVHPPPDLKSLPQQEQEQQQEEKENKNSSTSSFCWNEVHLVLNELSRASINQHLQQQQPQHHSHHHNEEEEEEQEHHSASATSSGKTNKKKQNDDDEDEEEVEWEEGEEGDEEVEWEDFDEDELDEARELSDDESEPEDPALLEAEIKFRKLRCGAQFFDHKTQNQHSFFPDASTVDLSLAEQFNLRPEILQDAGKDAEELAAEKNKGRKKKKMKSHHALTAASDPDNTVRITSQGYKQVVFDEDDDIDVYVHVAPPSQEQQQQSTANKHNNNNLASAATASATQQPLTSQQQLLQQGLQGGGEGDEGKKKISKRQLRKMEKNQRLKPDGGEGGFVKRSTTGMK